MTALSVLDLSPILEGGDARRALLETTELARAAERFGFTRFWLAEHHNMPGIASAATAVVLAHVAAATETIRVGSGGVMLPNHAPMVVAEQFPGDVLELQAFLADPVEGQRVTAWPGAGAKTPIWLLGSSLFSAELAAQLGLPFAFASHFAPELLLPALRNYREGFRPSKQLGRPYAMAAFNVFAADTDAEAARLSTSMQQAFAAVVTGKPGRLKPPVDDITAVLDARQLAAVESRLTYAAIGDRETVRAKLAEFIALTGVEEVMVTGMIHDLERRIRSLEITAEAAQGL